MIAKKITYDLRPGDELPFFASEPELCQEIFGIAKAIHDRGGEPTHEQHGKVWRHVGGCLACMRNIIRMQGQTNGQVPLPVMLPDWADSNGNPRVKIDPPPRERN